jgi:hypothetical protein
MRALNLAVIGAALLLSGAAAAKDKDQPEQRKEKKICKPQENSASRLGARLVCRTREEWARNPNVQQNGSPQTRTETPVE